MNPKTLLSLGTALAMLVSPHSVFAQVEGWATTRVVENLDRGIQAHFIDHHHDGLKNDVYISWRLFKADPSNITFDIYRNGQKLPGTISQTTDYVDTNVAQGTNVSYYVRPVINGSSGTASKTVVVNSTTSKNYISIPFAASFGKVGIGDLDGDGAYDYVVRVKQGSLDPYPSHWQPSSNTYKLMAYKSDGTHLWTYDMGPNIEEGVWYSPFVVYDFNGDGRAEIALKTAPHSPVYKDSSGRVTTACPEFLTILDGQTRAELAQVPWPNNSGFADYNERSRNQIGIAYLDGKTPCIVAARGTYGLMKVEAFQYHNNQLSQLWQWRNDQEAGYSNGFYRGQGSHSMHSADVDGDGLDEIILGAAVLNDDGEGLWALPHPFKHPDHTYVGDLDPSRPGLEIYMAFEHYGSIQHNANYQSGVLMVDAATGEFVWGTEETVEHAHGSGLVADIDPASPGVETYSLEDDKRADYYHTANGEISDYKGLFFDMKHNYGAVYWDADLQRETIVKNTLYNFPETPVSPLFYEPFSGSGWLSDWTIQSSDGRATLASVDNVARITQPGTGAWTFRPNEGFAVNPDEGYRLLIAYRISGVDGLTIKMAAYNNTTLVSNNILVGAPTASGVEMHESNFMTASCIVPQGVNVIVPQVTGIHADGISILDLQIIRDDNAGRGLNTVQGDVTAYADVIGDWREEIITYYKEGGMRIYTTSTPASDRRPTLMQDPIYRADVAHQAMGYLQVPTPTHLPSASTPTGVEVIVDNTDPAVTYTGSWSTSTTQTGFYGTNYQHDGNTGKGSKTAEFRPNLPATGLYRVYVRSPAYQNWADNVPVDIHHAGGVTGYLVDQRINRNQWVELGTHNFTAGTGGSVLFSTTETNKHVIVDAVKFVLVHEGSPGPEIILDNFNPSVTTFIGDWPTSNGQDHYYGLNYQHDGNTGKGNKSVRFTPVIPVTGMYEVYIRNPAWPNWASNVPVSVFHASGVSGYSVNQKLNAGAWISLGTHMFNAGTSGSVLVSTTGTTSSVIVDAVKFVPVSAPPIGTEFVVDNADPAVTYTGSWATSTTQTGFYGTNYQHDGNTGKGSKTAEFKPNLPVSGSYRVYVRSPSNQNWAGNVPVEVHHANGTNGHSVNQQRNHNIWVELSTYQFTAGTAGSVLFSTTETNKHVIVDAVKFVLVSTDE